MISVIDCDDKMAAFAERFKHVEPNGFKPRERISDENNPFVLTEESYVRDIHPVKNAVDQAAWHVHLQFGVSYAWARAWVVEQFKSKQFDIRNPTIRFMHRPDMADRHPDEMPIVKYLEAVIRDEEILAPTMTTYIATKKYESVLAGYILTNIGKRSKAKKAMFAAMMSGDKMEEFFKNLEQRNTKLSNNSISGAHASNSNALYNQSNHSSLTSNCRMTSGSGNANNEKLLSGNRHYWAPYIVINNIVSITQNTEYDKFEAFMTKYKLHYPTVKDTMDCITFSTELYWTGNKDILRIQQLVMSLSPIQRAAFVYTGDLYHLAKHNRDVVHRFIGNISSKTYGNDEQPHKQIRKLPEDYVHLAHQICEKEWAGVGKEYEKMFAAGKKPELDVLLATAMNTISVVKEYSDFIRCIFVSDNIPASIPYFPQSIRRAALTSDTDSTIFTTQWWVVWYYGEMVFGEKGSRVASTMIFIAAQAIVHILARMSINMGVDRKHMWRTAMKNEFYFVMFSPTEVAKHYFALRATQEGNVFASPKPEIKGVHLKSSSGPVEIVKKAEKFMVDSLLTVMAGKKIDLHAALKMVADIEREILQAFKSGDPRFSRRGQIQTPASYTKGPTESNYMHHIFWKEVFAPKYGFHEEPPYGVIKLSGGLNSPRETQEWLESISSKHPETADRVRAWMKKYDKVKLGSFMIPKAIADTVGVPEELMEAINVRKLTSNITSIYYLILRNFGYYGLDKKMHMLISDTY